MRKQWRALLQERSIHRSAVENKTGLTRLGFRGYKTLLNNEGRDVKVVNGAENGIEDLLQNLISIFLLSALGFVGKEEWAKNRKDY